MPPLTVQAETVSRRRGTARRRTLACHRALFGLLFVLLSLPAWGHSAEIALRQSARNVDCHTFVEFTIQVAHPPLDNPFTQAEVSGEFRRDGGASVVVDGFCDSEDGSILRLRFMPTAAGHYNGTLIYRRGNVMETRTATFTARKGKRPGMLRVDPARPFHFLWDGTGEHFFFNSTTAYWLLGWRKDSVIRDCLDRLDRLKVNRIRVALSGRTHSGQRWKEPLVVANDAFQFRLEPWPAAHPLDIENPGYDVTRFNLAYFHKVERMLRLARERDIVVSLIFHLDGADPGVDPFGQAGRGGPDEQRYYRYCVARFGAYANVTWDLANEWHLFRDAAWVEKMGALVRHWDPYHHATSVHGPGTFSFRTSSWCDFAMFQSWDEHGGYDFMLRNRHDQLDTGRPMPQVNEEYGYEDHYPFPWGEQRRWPARTAETRRKLAWEITFAGAYQTTGERANSAGAGGWLTGRGDDGMTMLAGYGLLRTFFEHLPWWRLDPRPDLAGDSTLVLAEPGRRYVLYLRDGGSGRVTLEPGLYHVERFNPRNGESVKLGTTRGGRRWQSRVMPDTEDWVLLLEAPGR